MRAEIHPDYMEARIVCACGRVTETRATVPELHVEICSHCHPFFTGKQKLVDTAGRVERFLSKYGREEDAEAVAAQARERSETGEKLELPEEMQLPESKPKRDEEEEELEVVGEEPGSPAASSEEGRGGERGREEAGTGSD